MVSTYRPHNRNREIGLESFKGQPVTFFAQTPYSVRSFSGSVFNEKQPVFPTIFMNKKTIEKITLYGFFTNLKKTKIFSEKNFTDEIEKVSGEFLTSNPGYLSKQ